MGYLQATEFAEKTSIEQGVEWQLRSNHYPPVPFEMIPVAIEAIEACTGLDHKRLIKTPFEHRRYGFKVPAWEIVANLHLEPWVG